MFTARISRSPIEPLEARIAPAAAVVALGTLDAAAGFKINGLAVGDGTGVSVSPAGDVNGDALDDFIIGARGADPNGDQSGAAYVVFGKVGGLTSVDLAMLSGTNGFKISGEAASDFAGTAVSRAGDIDGDGFDDLIVGAYGQDPGGSTGAGAAYIIYGKGTGFDANVQLSSPRVTKIAGASGENLFGFSVSAAGDVNGDGRDDLIIGAPSSNNFTGAAFVIFGQAARLGATFSLGSLDGANGFKVTGEAADDHAGRAVSGAGDIDGDGFDDVIIGAYGVDTATLDDVGAAYVIFGKNTAFAATIALSGLAAADGFRILGELEGDYAGWSVSGAGDIDGDSFDDLLIGGQTAVRGGHALGGTAYVVFGKSGSFGTGLNLSSLTGADGFEIPGHEDAARLGHHVNAAGDLNGDGFADVVIGATRARPGTLTDAGSSYVIFGKASAFTASFDLASLDGTNGFRINGGAAGDFAGFAGSAAGDLNADGIDDLLLGAAENGVAGSVPAGEGAAFILFGARPPIEFSKNFRTATFTDVDGDLITVKVSKGALSEADFEVSGTGQFLRLNLADDGQEFAGTTIKITAKTPRNGAGDGKVHVGAIAAADVDLGAVTVTGDLGQIDAGDFNPLTPGLAKLTVGSLGAFTNTQPGGTVDPLHSQIEGKLGGLKVAGVVKGVLDVDGALGAVSIGSHLDGSAAGAEAGLLRATGSIGSVAVKGSILGGADLAGIVAGEKLGKVSVSIDLSSADATKPVQISAPGKLTGTKAADHLAIAGLTVKGNVLNAQILAGYDALGATVNRDASIGAVKVTDAPAADGFGRNDTAIAGGLGNLIAKIASVTIQGAVSAGAGGGHFGLTAEQIGSAKIAGIKQALTKGTDTALPPLATNFTLIEV
jgi:hypothetical protein